MNTVHLMRGARVTSASGKWRLESVVIARDSLIIGPSSADATEHSRLRRQFWQDIARWRGAKQSGAEVDDLQLIRDIESFRREGNLCLWISDDPNDVLFCAWFFHAIDMTKRNCVSLAQMPAFEPMELNEFKQRSQDAVQVSQSEAHSYAELWRQFADGDLPLLWGNLDNTHTSVRLAIRDFLPLLTGQSIRLNRCDQLILEQFSEDFESHTAEVVPHILHQFPWLSETFLFHRIHRLSGSLLKTQTPSRWNLSSYCVTEAGIHARSGGIEQGIAIPSFDFGGASAYALTGFWAQEDPIRPGESKLVWVNNTVGRVGRQNDVQQESE